MGPDTAGLSLPFSALTVVSLLAGVGTGTSSIFSNEWMQVVNEGVKFPANHDFMAAGKDDYKVKNIQEALMIWDNYAECDSLTDNIKKNCVKKSFSKLKDKWDGWRGKEELDKINQEEEAKNPPRKIKLLRSLLKRLCIEGLHKGCKIPTENGVKELILRSLEMSSEQFMSTCQWIYVTHLAIVGLTALMVFRKIWTKKYDRMQIRIIQTMLAIGGALALLTTFMVFFSSNSAFDIGVGTATAFLGAALVFTAAASFPRAFTEHMQDAALHADDKGDEADYVGVARRSNEMYGNYDDIPGQQLGYADVQYERGHRYDDRHISIDNDYPIYDIDDDARSPGSESYLSYSQRSSISGECRCSACHDKLLYDTYGRQVSCQSCLSNFDAEDSPESLYPAPSPPQPVQKPSGARIGNNGEIVYEYANTYAASNR